MTKNLITSWKIALFLAATTASMSQAQILLSSGTYTQNFDALATTGGNTDWTNNVTLPGWYAARALPSPTVIINYRAEAGAGNSGALYSFGATNLTERALGSVSSGTSGAIAYGLRLQNDTSNGQTNFAITVTGEQWRNGGNVNSQKLAFFYRVDGTPLTDPDPATNNATWNAFSALDFTNPTVGSTAAALDGNAPTNRQTFSAVVLTGLVLLPGQELFLRWLDVNDAGNDHAIALDDLTITFSPTTAAPTPPSFIAQPQSQTVNLGNTATFTVQAGGTAPLFYQWNYEGNPISGATGTALVIPLANTDQAGNYSVTVTNAVDAITSTNAVLTINIVPPIQTNIAYLRTLMTPNYAPADTTNLYRVEGTVTTFVNLTSATNSQFYLQDDTAGLAIFISGSLFRPAAGDRVRVTGPLGHFNGLFEMNLLNANPAHFVEIISNNAAMPAPELFQFSLTNNLSLMETNIEGSVVVVSNVFLQGAGTTFCSDCTGGNGTNYNMTNLNGDVFILRLDARVSEVIGQPIPEFAASITGVMSQFDNSSPFTTGYQLTIRQLADLVPGTPPAPSVSLQILSVGNALEISWPNTAAGFTLESTPSLTTPNWQPVGQTPTDINGRFTVNLGQPPNHQFYRLQHN